MQGQTILKHKHQHRQIMCQKLLFFVVFLISKQPKFTDFTNQVGQPRDLSLCRSRSGTIFNSSIRLTMARGTWETQHKRRAGLSVIMTGQHAGRLFVGRQRMKNLLHYGGCPELAGYEGRHSWLRKRSVGKECFLTNSQRREGGTNQSWEKIIQWLLWWLIIIE